MKKMVCLIAALFLNLSMSVFATRVAVINPDHHRTLKHGLKVFYNSENDCSAYRYLSIACGEIKDSCDWLNSTSCWTGLGTQPDFLGSILKNAGYTITYFEAAEMPSIDSSNYDLVIVQDPLRTNLRQFTTASVESGEPDLLEYVNNSTFVSRLKSYINDGGRVIFVGDAVKLLQNSFGKTVNRHRVDNTVSVASCKIPSDWLFVRGNPFCGQDRRTSGTYTVKSSSLVSSGTAFSELRLNNLNDLARAEIWSETVYYPSDGTSLLDVQVVGNGQYVLSGTTCSPPVYSLTVNETIPHMMGYSTYNGHKVYYIGSDAYFDYLYKNNEGAWHAGQYSEINYAISQTGKNAVVKLAEYALENGSSNEWSFVHLTDLHLGGNCSLWVKNDKDCGTCLVPDMLSNNVELAAAIYDIKHIVPKPRFVLVTGDVVDLVGNSNESFQTSKRIIEMLGDDINVYVVPGNHDRWKCVDPYDVDNNCSVELKDGFDKIFGNPIATGIYHKFDVDGLLFIGLDTGNYDGKIETTQQEYLNSLSTDDNLKPKVIFMHHPVIDVAQIIDIPFIGPKTIGPFSILPENGQDSFLRWCSSSNVQLVLSGHSHKSCIYNENQEEVAPNTTNHPQFIQTSSTSSVLPLFQGVYRLVKVKDKKTIPQECAQTTKKVIVISLFSPANLHVYDGSGNHTGLTTDSRIESSVADSFYFNHYVIENNEGSRVSPEQVVIFDPKDTYVYQVIGKKVGFYRLEIKSSDGEGEFTVEANNIPTQPGAIHEYLVNWEALAAGQEGVLVQVDNDGDGSVEKTIVSDATLTTDDFNKKPFAYAGQDQTVYAWAEGTAQVTLDGSGSSDEDGDELIYTWILNGSVIATGVNPTVPLSSGMHAISLVVSDGLVESEVDEVKITVIAPLQGKLQAIPSSLSRSSTMRYVVAVFQLPAGVTKLDGKLKLYPGGIQSTLERVVQVGANTQIYGWFEKQQLMNTVATDGTVELMITGKQLDGTCVYAKAKVVITK